MGGGGKGVEGKKRKTNEEKKQDRVLKEKAEGNRAYYK